MAKLKSGTPKKASAFRPSKVLRANKTAKGRRNVHPSVSPDVSNAETRKSFNTKARQTKNRMFLDKPKGRVTKVGKSRKK